MPQRAKPTRRSRRLFHWSAAVTVCTAVFVATHPDASEPVKVAAAALLIGAAGICTLAGLAWALGAAVDWLVLPPPSDECNGVG